LEVTFDIFNHFGATYESKIHVKGCAGEKRVSGGDFIAGLLGQFGNVAERAMKLTHMSWELRKTIDNLRSAL
jgi:hypothetical protein